MKTRLTLIAALSVFAFISCENPLGVEEQEISYKGQIVLRETAPFVLQSTGLAKITSDAVIIADDVESATVYGLTTDSATVYEAEGGEVLPEGVWVDNANAEAFQSTVLSQTTIYFKTLVPVLLIDPVDTYYLDEDGDWKLATQGGLIEAQAIQTGETGGVTIESSALFGIGGDGGDIG